MSRAVLISIRPKWCELIASGKKTIEVRKTRPKLELPFKCYIYCTKDKRGLDIETDRDPTWLFGTDRDFGNVIGEFVCYKILDWHYIPDPDESADPGSMAYDVLTKDGEKTGLEYDDFEDYGKGSPLYGWCISNLIIYDEPKSLNSFTGLRKTKFGYAPYEIKRPGQSWSYVEEIE